MELLKPELIMAVERLEVKLIKKFLYSGWDVNFPLTSVGIGFLSLVMGIDPEILMADGCAKQYLEILKSLKKTKPRANLHITDKLGRTCMHHAASTGNVLGIEFIVKLMRYWHEKDSCENDSDDKFLQSVKSLIEKRSSGGLTALMLASKANSVHSVKILLELGADPNQVDN